MRAQRHRLTALALVLAVHGLLSVLPMGRHAAIAPHLPTATQPPMAWMLDLVRELPQLQPSRAQHSNDPAPLPPPQLAPSARPRPRTAVGAAAQNPAAPTAAVAAAVFETPAAAALAPDMPTPASTPAAHPAALNLSLPRAASASWRQVNSAVQAQIGRAAPLTVETSAAKAAARTGPRTQERIENSSAMRAAACSEVVRNAMRLHFGRSHIRLKCSRIA